MAKVAFIYPGYENLGVEALSAALKRAGHQTKLIFDPILFSESGCVSYPWLGKMLSFRRQIPKKINDFYPDLICFSVLSDNYGWAISLAEDIKVLFDIPIVFGGIHPTTAPLSVIQESVVDYVCVGEGDEAIVELTDMLERKENNLSIKNIYFKKNGEIITNDLRPLIQDLDSLPFPDKNIFYESAPIFNFGYLISTSRGCPYECSFCCNNVLKSIYKQKKGDYLRRRSIDHVLEELGRAKELYNPNFVAFVDDTFNFDFSWLEIFLLEYKRKINLPFSCYLAPGNINANFVKLLSECGCFKVQFGIQSIDDRVRIDVLKRVYTNNQIAEMINLFKSFSIYTVCDNILGLQGQKEEELLRLAYFYKDNMPSLIEMFWLRYYPGTLITQQARQQGVISDGKYSEIEKGEISLGIVRGGDHYQQEMTKIQLMLNLFHFLPLYWKKLLLRGWFRKIPSLFPATQFIIVRLLFWLFRKEAKFDMYRVRTFARYRYYCLKKIKYMML